MRHDSPEPAYDVPPDRTAVECRHCGRPFDSEFLLALHRGRSHPDAVDDDERQAYEEAYDAETSRLGRFRLKAVALLVLLYFGFLMVYAVV
ncbi:C2H2-type zinc finger protein [Halosimplex salinum]|uniref:C2H2-type zinc finger protein n=1 Tax=Halosimplex salinum TaxID=1710538 RepID=UPI000F481D4A|nr:C2H2-type zinc finger protein [Halosimplex salinum]